MATQSETYMGFTIMVYAHPVAWGYVPFATVVRHTDMDEEFKFQPPSKIHQTADAAIRDAIYWGRDLVDKLAEDMIGVKPN